MTNIINFDPTRTRVWVQPGSFASRPKQLAAETTVSGPSGGGFSSESDFLGDGTYRGSRVTGNPDRITFDIMGRYAEQDALRSLMFRRPACYFNVMVAYGCPPEGLDNFQLLELFIDVGTAGVSASENIAQGMEMTNPKVLDTLNADAAMREVIKPVAHQKISASVSTVAFNDILAIGARYCNGSCGYENDGQREFIAVGSPVGPATIPRIFYTSDDGNTWIMHTLAGIADGDAESVALFGQRVIVAVSGTSGGIWTVSLSTVKTSGGTLSLQLAGGISSGTVVNKVFAVGSLVFACGATGGLWFSDDGGFSFTAITSGVATALSAIGASDDGQVWIGGATQTLLRVRGTYQVGAITVTGLTGDITAIAVPPYRGNEVFVGTSTGEIWHTTNANDPTPTWTELKFDKPSTSSIEDLEFAGTLGCSLWVVQTNGSSQSRVLVDYTGGAMGAFAMAVGTFTSPANSIINAIAPTGVTHALTVGEVNTAAGFIGRVSS